MTATGSARWAVEEIETLRGYGVEWAEPGCFVLSRRNRLFVSDSPAGSPRPICDVPAPVWKRLVSRSRAAQRLLRFMFYNVLKLSDGSFFVAFDKHIGVADGGRFRALAGLLRPCRVLRSACATDGKGDLYFGEYLTNPDRHAVPIYRYRPGNGSVEVVHTFAPNEVRHVHGIYADARSQSLWCVTGDNGRECRMLRTRDGFNTLEEIGGGDETWRCVSLLFTEENVYYATDAEFRQNVIYRMERKSGSRIVVQEVDGPVYYTASVRNDLFFAVAAELCPSQTSPSTTLWNIEPTGTCTQIASFPKDSLPVRFFLAGNLSFPRGPGLPGELLFHGVGLKGIDNRTYRLRLEGRNGDSAR